MKKKTTFDFKSIKSFEDACSKTGLNPSDLPDVSNIPERFRKYLIAAYKLAVIFEAINDEWEADFTNLNQMKYFPWMRVNSAGSGFAFSLSSYHYAYTHTNVGSRLCTNTRKKALYIGKQFAEEYADFFLKR